MTTQSMANVNALCNSKIVKVVNGERTENGSEGLVSAAAACRMLGVTQYGAARKQMRSLGVPVVALGGAGGGVYLVRVADVIKARAKREALAEQKAAKAKSNVIEKPQPAPVEETATLESVNTFINELSDRVDAMDAKLDKLLAAWGIDPA